MYSVVIEGGLYFLLALMPFAFGGVENWAIGIMQIVAGIMAAAWITHMRPDRPGSQVRRRGVRVRQLRPIWLPAALFGGLALLQLLPMPPSILRLVSPGTHSLYARSFPDYQEGRSSDTARLQGWLVETMAASLPPAAATAGTLPEAPVASSGFPTGIPAWRPATLYSAATWHSLGLLTTYLMVFMVVAGYFHTRPRYTRLLWALAFVAFALSVQGILQKLNWNGKLLWIRGGEFSQKGVFGPFVNRNSYAAFAATIFPIGITMGLGALQRLREGVGEALARLILWGMAAAAIGAGVAYSLSRGGILTAGLSLLLVAVMVIYFGRQRLELAVIGAMAAAAVIFLVAIGPEQVVERLETLEEGAGVHTFGLRLGAWERCLSLIADYPLLGTGLGTYRFAFMRYAPPGESWWTTAHNEYLEVACDTGLAGFALLILGVMGFLYMVARPGLFRETSDRYAFMGIVAGLTGLVVHSFVSSNFQVPAIGLLLVVLSGALVALVARQSGRPAR